MNVASAFLLLFSFVTLGTDSIAGPVFRACASEEKEKANGQDGESADDGVGNDRVAHQQGSHECPEDGRVDDNSPCSEVEDWSESG